MAGRHSSRAEGERTRAGMDADNALAFALAGLPGATHTKRYYALAVVSEEDAP